MVRSLSLALLCLTPLCGCGGVVKPAGSFRLLASDGKVVLTGEDIVDYDWSTHTMTLKPGERQSMPIGHGQVFKVEANGEVCYEGVYVSAASSSRPWQTCPIILSKETGLPPDRWDSAQRISLPDSFEGTDPRGDERIHAALASLGKLKQRFLWPRIAVVGVVSAIAALLVMLLFGRKKAPIQG